MWDYFGSILCSQVGTNLEKCDTLELNWPLIKSQGTIFDN